MNWQRPYLLYMKGGLGNQLFQLCAGTTIADEIGCGILIRPVMATHHSDIFYFDNLFRNWSHLLAAGNVPTAVSMHGYYQDYRIFEDRSSRFVDQLDWTGFDNISRYGEVDNSIFIHVRGGDYLQPGFRDIHHVDLKQYYKNALERCKDVTHAYVFTNDKAYLESIDECFADIRHTVVSGNPEITDLYLMSQCAKGGIAANSTFSWWGLYLDHTRKHMMLPSKWFNDDKNAEGLYFPEAQRVSVI